MLIEQIRAKIQAGQFKFSKHAVDQSILRRISVQELYEAIAGGEVMKITRRTNMARVAWCWALQKRVDRFIFSAVTLLGL